MPDYSGDQGVLEKWMADLGESRYRQHREEAYEKKREGRGGAVARLTSHALDATASGLEDYLAKVKVRKAGKNAIVVDKLREVGAEVAALITCRTVLDQISRRVEYHQLVRTIGKNLQEEMRWRKFRKEQGPHFRKLIKKLAPLGHGILVTRMRKAMDTHKIEFEPWSMEERVKLGVICVEAFIEQSGLVEIVKGFNWDRPKFSKKRGRVFPRTEKLVVATKETSDWLKRSHELHAKAAPVMLPMLDVPVPWAGLYGGGYATDFFLQRPLVKTVLKKHEEYYKEIPENILSAVNKTQETPWEINENVYQVMAYFWEEGVPAADLPLSGEKPLPPKPDMDNEEKKKEWKAAAHRIHRDNHLGRSRRLLSGRTLWVAKEFLGKTFYFPQQLDSRGRMYPRPYALQPQGDDQARGLLRFAVGMPVATPEAERWFKIHGANTWGNDKVTFEERVKWVEDNEDMILRIHADPLDCREWEDADEPWQFLAWCLEYGEWKNDPEGFRNKIPVQMDGSNNGLQLYSLLLRDRTTAVRTNVAPTDAPEDIYKRVGETLVDILRASDEPEAEEWLRYFDGEVPRDLCKRPVMTLVYGVTKWSATTYVIDWYEDREATEEEHPMGQTYRQACKYLSQKLWEATEQNIGAAIRGMKWLREVADICSEHNLPIYWTAPSGFPVYQEYTMYKRKVVQVALGDRAYRWCRIRKHNEDKIAKAPQRQGLPPNYVHSIDASILMGVINRMESPVNVIHDSFGTHAASCGALANALREEIAEIFSDDLLTKLAEDVIVRLPEGIELPPVPTLGDFNPQEIKSSIYCYA